MALNARRWTLRDDEKGQTIISAKRMTTTIQDRSTGQHIDYSSRAIAGKRMEKNRVITEAAADGSNQEFNLGDDGVNLNAYGIMAIRLRLRWGGNHIISGDLNPIQQRHDYYYFYYSAGVAGWRRACD